MRHSLQSMMRRVLIPVVPNAFTYDRSEPQLISVAGQAPKFWNAVRDVGLKRLISQFTPGAISDWAQASSGGAPITELGRVLSHDSSSGQSSLAPGCGSIRGSRMLIGESLSKKPEAVTEYQW